MKGSVDAHHVTVNFPCRNLRAWEHLFRLLALLEMIGKEGSNQIAPGYTPFSLSSSDDYGNIQYLARHRIAADQSCIIEIFPTESML